MSEKKISKKGQSSRRVQYAAKHGRKENGDEKCSRTPWERVVEYYESDDNLSIIELDTGAKIHVALPFEDLRDRMERSWSKYDTCLDLKDVTGQTAFLKSQENKLTRLFNIGALKETAAKDDMLILMYVYDSSSMKSGHCVAFLESELNDVEKENNIYYLKLENFSTYKNSWGCSDLNYGPYVNISASEIRELLEEAKQRGDVALDVMEETKPKGKSFDRIIPKMTKASKHFLI